MKIAFLILTSTYFFGTSFCDDTKKADEIEEYVRKAVGFARVEKWRKSYNALNEAWRLYNVTKAGKLNEAQILLNLQYVTFRLDQIEEADFYCRKILSMSDLDQTIRSTTVEARKLYKQWKEADKMEDTEVPTEAQIKEAQERVKEPRYHYCNKEFSDPTMNAKTANPKLFCRYSSRNLHPLLILAPVKEEFLSLEPLLVLFHQIITPKEMAFLKSVANPQLVWTGQNNLQYTNVTSQFRGRKNKSIRLFNFSLPSLSRRIEAYTGLNPYGDGSEVFQVSRYRTSGHLGIHFDALPPIPQHKHLRRTERIATLNTYISDVKEGGGTVFPLLNFTVNVQAGTGAFWFNYYRNRTHDTRVTHGSCPVLHGEKWIVSKWFRVWGQLFHKPSLTSKSEQSSVYKMNDLEMPKYLHFVKRLPEEFVNPPEEQEAW